MESKMPVEFAKKSKGSKRLYPRLDIVDGGMTLSVEDDGGNTYAIVSIGSSGRLYRHFGLPAELGLGLEETGRIAEDRPSAIPVELYWMEFSNGEPV
jgi:hypothetical protein